MGFLILKSDFTRKQRADTADVNMFPFYWWIDLWLKSILEAYFCPKMSDSLAALCFIMWHSHKEPRASGSTADHAIIGGTIKRKH